MSKNTAKKALEYVKSYPVPKVKLAITDIDGILRGKVMHRDKFLGAAEKGFGFCDVVFGWDAADVAYDNGKFTGWHSGYPDADAKIDLDTFRKVPWDNDIPFFLADFLDRDGEPLSICPRSLLKKIRDRSISAGYKPMFSQEFEWFNFRETADSLHNKNFLNPTPLTPGMFGYSILRSSLGGEFFNGLFDQLQKFDVPIEGLHTETGPGVYEAAIVYDDILTSADRAVLFKSGAKEIGQQQGIIASFMAKWHPDLPGCSGHIHQSLWDEKSNLFHSDDDELNMSAIMRSYVAGQLHCLPYILPMYAPTINSYKRLVEGAWAPTTLTWSRDNRTVALRVLSGGKSSCRLESRVCGSDVNPYLAMAAALASGLYGIQKNLSLDQPMTVGNGYEDFSNGILPKTLDEATKAMKESDLSNELFGEEFTDHFIRTREWEWRQYNQAITDWEMKRYFEII